MSIGEIIAILGLLLVILQTIIAWMSHEGIRLSLSSSDWIRLFMVLMASAFIVGGLFEASGESLFVFFVGNFLVIELMIVLDDWIPNDTVVSFVLSGLLFCFVCWIFFIPLLSHVCMIRSVIEIKQSFQCLESSLFLDSGYGTVYTITSLTFYILGWMNLVYRKNNRAIVRLTNWLACGIGVCLGFWFHFIFFDFV